MSIVWSKKGFILIASILSMGLLLGSLVYALQKPVTIEVDGNLIKSRVIFARTVGKVLDKNHIKLEGKDKVEPSYDTAVKKNMHITVVRAFNVKVVADGESRDVYTTPVTVKDAIVLAGFELGEKDIVKTLPVAMVVPQQEIEVIRVSEKEICEDEEMPYQVERTTDATLELGLSRTIQPGKNGIARNTMKVTYHNGQEVNRTIVKMETLLQPQTKVVAMGNITSVSRGGQRMDFREAKLMQATAYTYTGFRTATGTDPAVGMVAVDPNIIPLGSKLYIDGYGYACAADTGGAVRGNIVDLFMEEYAQCVNWGRKDVKVYILP